ncbi:hypothetical protein J2X69_000373 [Algoriphagus sp. 4150]|uniref:DUF3885 domain-containing protein n=1 Tax=Algoriphagus sp. 4150 TaxID=2817756 RepID=UPI00285FC05B|nr:hypothetical protein [Algoriphagus sp. 4150]MDR7128045.1 hypothetical protein [Algoriphagus sp. 4150]
MSCAFKMTESEFIDYWKRVYPEAYLIGHELKWVYPDRWFRIHSLPESKRYAEDEIEYQIIFERQNQLITDLIGEGTEIMLAFGLYVDDDLINLNYREMSDFVEFQKIMTIDLQKERPEEQQDELYLDIFLKADTWRRNKRNELLKKIADDEIRAMFICPSRNCVIAPYDGGVDIIVQSTKIRDQLRNKYGDWLSNREDGLGKKKNVLQKITQVGFNRTTVGALRLT